MIENKIKENLLNKVMKKIKEEQVNIKKANQVDKKYYNMNISIEKLLEISEELKKQDLRENTKENILVIHNGNPYITYILVIKAIVNEINMKLYANETMLGTNLVLLKIIQEVEKEMKIQTNIAIKRDIKIEEIRREDANIIVLGDISKYGILKKYHIENVKYNAKNNISIYIENESLEELKRNILQYCADNLIEIEVYEAENIKEAISQIEVDNQGEKVLLLTKEKIDKEEIKRISATVNKNILQDFEKEFIRI